MSNLSSLLQYRFVKRGGAKSDQNSDQSSTCSTQPPSQSTTVSPGTPDKKPAIITVTPDSKISNTTDNNSSPDSPIFASKVKLIDRSYDTVPFTPSPSSSNSSPWLSKQNGHALNGAANTTKPKSIRKYPTFSDGDSDDDITSMPEFEPNRKVLLKMFPSIKDQDVTEALIQTRGVMDEAMDVLIDIRQKKKRVRKISNESISDGEVKPKPRKRIKKLPSESGDDATEHDSQSTVQDSQSTLPYGLESQRSDATEIYEVEDVTSLTEEQEKNVSFMKTCFKDKSKQELVRALRNHDWNTAEATIALSSNVSLKSVASETNEQVKKAAIKKPRQDFDSDLEYDEESDYESGEDSDDSVEEEGADGKQVFLNFFGDASQEELMATPGCSKKKSELIMQQRPFKNWDDLVTKFTTTKGLAYNLIGGCREVIKIREVIARLMKRCERISEVMENSVENLIHSTTNLDDVNQITKQPSNLNSSMTLKPFQMVGLNWLRIIHSQEINGILADEMGLGKTIQTIAFLAYLLQQGEKGPHIIIVPSSTIDNWIREAKVWCPTMKVLVYYGSQEERRATRQYIMFEEEQDYNVIITTYNMCSSTAEDRALFKRFEFYYAVFDEGHLLKNMSSLRYQNLMKISAHRRLLLTGTPLQNNLLELMSLLCFVMPDMFVGKTEQLKHMFTMFSKNTGDDKRSHYEQERIAHAKSIMKPFVLRRLKSEVMSQLPPKTEKVEHCFMIPDQEALYHRLIDSFSKEVKSEEKAVSQRGSAMLMQLRKAANHPLLHRVHYTDEKIQKMAKKLCREPSHQDRGALPELVAEDMRVMSDFELHKCCLYYKPYLKEYLLDQSVITASGKFRVLDNYLDFYKKEGNRVLLFSQFTSVLDIMEEFMKDKTIKYLRLDGQTPVPDRQKLIDEFNNDKEIFVFLLSTRAGGLGINLTSANVVILHDIDFNPYNDKQAEDRCHRVGQTRDVKIVRLICKGTVEEAMLQCAREKLKLEKDVISTDDLDTESGNQKDVVSILRQALGEDFKVKS